MGIFCYLCGFLGHADDTCDKLLPWSLMVEFDHVRRPGCGEGESNSKWINNDKDVRN